jgi:hypothetical protein
MFSMTHSGLILLDSTPYRYKNEIVSFCGFQSFCLALRYKYGVLRKILGPKMDEETGYPKILHAEKLLTKCYSVDAIEKTGMGGACEKHGAADRCMQSVGGET